MLPGVSSKPTKTGPWQGGMQTGTKLIARVAMQAVGHALLIMIPVGMRYHICTAAASSLLSAHTRMAKREIKR